MGTRADVSADAKVMLWSVCEKSLVAERRDTFYPRQAILILVMTCILTILAMRSIRNYMVVIVEVSSCISIIYYLLL
jgi:hypothetical protein